MNICHYASAWFYTVLGIELRALGTADKHSGCRGCFLSPTISTEKTKDTEGRVVQRWQDSRPLADQAEKGKGGWAGRARSSYQNTYVSSRKQKGVGSGERDGSNSRSGERNSRLGSVLHC